MCTQAPFGRGMETVVDTSVRNALELPADKLTLANQDEWEARLREVVVKEVWVFVYVRVHACVRVCVGARAAVCVCVCVCTNLGALPCSSSVFNEA